MKPVECNTVVSQCESTVKQSSVHVCLQDFNSTACCPQIVLNTDFFFYLPISVLLFCPVKWLHDHWELQRDLQGVSRTTEGNAERRGQRLGRVRRFLPATPPRRHSIHITTLASAAVINIINNDGSASRCQLQEHLMKDFIRVISMSASYHDVAKCVLSALCQINYLQTVTTGGGHHRHGERRFCTVSIVSVVLISPWSWGGIQQCQRKDV